MANGHEFPRSPQQHAEQVLGMSKDILHAAVSIVLPDAPETSPLDAFPNPKQLRAEDEGIILSDEQKASLLDQAQELGFGRPASVTLSEQGLSDAIVVLEGGQPHKMLAEALVVARDEEAKPHAVIVAASAQRKVENPAEIASAEHLFDGGNSPQTGLSEYDMALQMLPRIPGFRGPNDSELQDMGEMNFAYDINNDYQVSYFITKGQFTLASFLGGGGFNAIPITMLRVDGEEHVADDGRVTYTKRPAAADILKILDDTTKHGNISESPIVFVTSGVYRPSRALGVALAGLRSQRTMGLATYGNDLVNEVRGTQLPPPVNQLPGELHEMARQAVALEQALKEPAA